MISSAHWRAGWTRWQSEPSKRAAMLSEYSDKVAVVTGAVKGLGRALATELAGRKCHLALVEAPSCGDDARSG